MVCCLLSKFNFQKDSFRNNIRVANGLDPDQDQCSVSPDLSQNCLQRLLADEKRKELNLVARPNVQDHNFVLEIKLG